LCRGNLWHYNNRTGGKRQERGMNWAMHGEHGDRQSGKTTTQTLSK
jgi:hypothetical protein